MTVGIYEFYNKVTEFKYIGSSFDIEARYKKHLSSLKLGKHHNRYLQNSYNVHGIDSFSFTITIECENDISDTDLREKENIYLQSHDKAKCYNECPVAGSTKGRVVSQEQKDKVSQKLKGRKRPSLKIPLTQSHKDKIAAALKGKYRDLPHPSKGKSYPENYKKVAQLNMFDEIIEIFDSLKHAELVTGIYSSRISEVCHGKKEQSNGYKWKFV
jgi:group I intron endonuclease